MSDLIARIEKALSEPPTGFDIEFATRARTLLPECASHIEYLELSYGGARDTADELKEENRRLLDALKTARTALEFYAQSGDGSVAGDALAELDVPAAEET
jgi:hypothetical protein